MPYEILEQGIGYVVVKQGTHQIVGRHKTLAEARAHLRALYANVRDGQVEGTFEVVDWFTGAVVATLADLNAATTVADIMRRHGLITTRKG